MILYAFDVLELDGVDQRPSPLEARKGLLEKALANPEAGIQLNEHLTGDGAMIFDHACRLAMRRSNITELEFLPCGYRS